MILMALPNEHLMTFNQYKDAKSLFAAIKARFGGNEATKKIHKTLLKQMYKNFSAPSTESLDYIFNKLQKIVSQLAILGEFISQEDLNLKFFRSLPSKWNTYVVVWRNKSDLNTMSINDLYNNFKIVEQEDCACGKTPSKAIVAIDEVGFDWSYMAKDEVPRNMALMAFSDSEKSNLSFTKIMRPLFVVLTRDMSIKDSEINVLKSELENINQEKEGIQLKNENFDNASKSLDNLLGSQITDKSKNGLGFQSYNVVLPPAKLVYNTGRCKPLSIDLSYSGLEEFKQHKFESCRPKSCEIESKNASKDIPNELKEYTNAPLVKDMVSDNKDCSVESPIVVEKKTVVHTIAKVKVVRLKQLEKSVRKIVRYAEMYRSQGPRENQRNWNNLKSQQLGSHPQKVQEDQGYVDSGCSRHMTGNMSYLLDFKGFNRGCVTFGGGANGSRITGKGTIKTCNLDFEDMYFVKELKFNLFSVSRMCHRKNNVLFTDTK
uniref:Retrovirus-related Pol polyprotein from transposon TNT 1-94-like beta-barrel domain-containing protein n=1 Tax=Tanacetum cinerariifolium TaxID=118510 RepID=A0A699HW13_TANCI|nr:hypothetical protein [Tanacetum cinerariifolium]